ncbi:5-formyltetrahydrofolate cyclo-ligase [Candidatus Dojkabacteria bacterium]|nr:5-formyltetrahydrofolate cyclo-ligase [Candidatus Dojkabacteria bacterium]
MVNIVFGIKLLKAKQKQHIRTKKKGKRGKLSPEEVAVRSAQIAMAFLEEFDLNNKSVLIYLPQKGSNEVDTWQLLDDLLNEGAKVYASVYDHEQNQIEVSEVDEKTEFIEDKLGIPTPQKARMIEKEDSIKLDLIIIPLIAFDLKGNRIGHGKGTYDRFLKSSVTRNAIKIGLAYDFQLVKKGIPAEANDVEIDYCITDERIYKF